ncbi:GNAT family N-acetyltransferase [Mariniplasma anaerobium]|uniref:Putative N-acetyltransferase YnaD n=1 Tax=Mariniplasma anaerobium TaxID=2735436 RepID=A0A7U9TJD7_9MOLU|nr:GNAT family N-acetyltransferase [Mariniplasma anaerobium]BCR35255.1 putative N-acetyltransferase YnaD [Mariniplasma anaerobium]
MIQTSRLIIEYAQTEDLDDIYEYVSNKEVMKYEREDFPTKAKYEELLNYFIEHKLLYVIRLKDLPKVIGHIFLGKTNPAINNEYNIGYILNPLFHNKGYCSEASKAIINYAFLELHANRVRAACNPENIPSWKVMEKIGLKKEGYFKKRFFMKNDEFGHPIYTDQVMYGIHCSDWHIEKNK